MNIVDIEGMITKLEEEQKDVKVGITIAEANYRKSGEVLLRSRCIENNILEAIKALRSLLKIRRG